MPWRGCYKKQVSRKVLEQMLLQDLHTEAWKYPSWSHSDSPRSCCMASKPNHPLWREEGSPEKTASGFPCPAVWGLAGTLPAQIWSEEQGEDIQEPSLSQQKQAKLQPNPLCHSSGHEHWHVTAPAALGAPSVPAGLLEIRMGAWDTAAIILI